MCFQDPEKWSKPVSDKTPTIFEPVTDVDAARELRLTVERHLLEIVAAANKAKADVGLNLDFAIQRTPEGVFLPEGVKVKITKDM
jgi:hypothetical protein